MMVGEIKWRVITKEECNHTIWLVNGNQESLDPKR